MASKDGSDDLERGVVSTAHISAGDQVVAVVDKGDKQSGEDMKLSLHQNNKNKFSEDRDLGGVENKCYFPIFMHWACN